MEESRIRLIPMTDELFHRFYREYENDPALYYDKAQWEHYVYSEERTERYIRRQRDRKRVPLAVMLGEEPIGEILIKNIEPGVSGTLSIVLKNDDFKDRGYGTQAERLAVRYAFEELDLPVLYADTVRTNARSRRVLEKVGFRFLREDPEFDYFRIDRPEINERK